MVSSYARLRRDNKARAPKPVKSAELGSGIESAVIGCVDTVKLSNEPERP